MPLAPPAREHRDDSRPADVSGGRILKPLTERRARPGPGGRRAPRPRLGAVLLGALATAAAVAAGCGSPGAADGRRVVVLGIDGMDPGYLQRFIDEGRLPNFARLAAEGSFARLRTSMPPLSPVAWSNFITGMDPGGHGVFDFLHREAATIEMYPPTYRVLPAGRSLRFGTWELPLTGGGVELVRRGRALWEILEDAGVPTTVYRMPMNFPPVEAGRALSGMGTPDVLGTSGTYALYADYPPANADDLSGGAFQLVEVVDHRVQARLVGPPNTFRRLPSQSGTARLTGAEPSFENPELEIDFEVLLDPDAPAARIVIQDAEIVLNEGEWSDWVGVEFEAVPFVAGVGAAARFYLQEVRPDFRLYVTPLQIDPANPALPLSTPTDWASELSAALDRFYTQELPEDTDAYLDGVFTAREFWEQARFVYGEQRRALDHALAGFDEGFLFFYFSSVDQGSHMLHHFADRDHPAFVEDDLLAAGLATLYEDMDEALGRVVEWIGDAERTTLIVRSDHGFTPWYWTVQL
ncbi:MAG: alkaline phosphatase family protein, partial [Acidobacteria bacterium]|nr:alkaline phosphatase family protein [Acidobacteriota bacterium]